MSAPSTSSRKKDLVQVWPHVKRLYSRFGRYIRVVEFLIVLGLVSNILSVIAPQYLSAITNYVSDRIADGTAVDLGYVAGIVMILIVLYALASGIQYYSSRTSWVTEEKVGHMIRTELSQKVSRIPVAKMDGLRKGDILSRFINDTDTIRLRSTDCIIDTADALVLLVATVIMMFLTDWRLAVVAVFPTIVGFLVIRSIMRYSQKYYREQSKGLGKLNTIVEETFRGLEVIKTYNGLDTTKKIFQDVNDGLYRTAFNSRLMGSVMPQITGLVNNTTYVLVCVIGSLLILEGTSTFGAIVAFIVYVKLMNMPLDRLTRSLNALQEVGAASERIFEFLDYPEMDDGPGQPAHLEHVAGQVRFEDVCFSYVPGKEVIHHLTLDVDVGRRIAIVGPTGAGKTTISNLLLRYYEPDSGRILLDGIPLTDINREELRGLFGVVLQETWLFQGTLRENLVFGNTATSDEHILKVCRAVGLEQFISGLEDGLNTEILEPQNLSSGQRQQIAIARAIIKDAPLLIMDEATSSVDTNTERHIQQAMDRLMEGRTSFVIAHRLSTIVSADLILVIDKGKIIEKGTHSELLALNGFYRNLYDSQFECCD